MVVWIFAGGGQSEIRALRPFLEKNIRSVKFERKTPIRTTPGPRPGQENGARAVGKTGRSLRQQIKKELPIALSYSKCDVILILDDLDCRSSQATQRAFMDTLESIEGAKSIKKIVGLAVPELEAWLIADWENTFEKDVEFRGKHQELRHWLVSNGLSLQNPEEFSSYDPQKDSCREKLSDLLIEATNQVGTTQFRKSEHTPRLLMAADPTNISRKCGHFKEFFNKLKGF